MPIYLDYAAATPVDRVVVEVMRPYWTDQFYNPSASYKAAIDVAKELDAAKSRIAHHLGARGSEIIFTAGGTEANNLAIHGVMRQHPQGNVVVSAVEHDSVLSPASQYEARVLPVLADGRIDLGKLAGLIDDKTVLVSVIYANNEIGTIQPVRQAALLINDIRKRRKRGTAQATPLYFHSDACQAAAYLDLHAARLGVDLLTINGGKIYGPKQSGALYSSRDVKLAPLIVGGGQEHGLRAGTENVAQCVGLAAALDLVQNRRQEESRRLSALQSLFFSLIKQRLPGAVVNGSLSHRLPNNLHLTFPGANNERLIMELDQRGIQCAAGSACGASSEQVSHVLNALGLSESDARSSLRFTMGISTDKTAIRKIAQVLAELCF
jgi:cysteine desulfurase